MSPNATSVSLHFGNATLGDAAAPHSHSANTNTIEAARSTEGRVAQAAAARPRLGPAVTRPVVVSTDVATQPPACPTLLTAASSCARLQKSSTLSAAVSPLSCPAAP